MNVQFCFRRAWIFVLLANAALVARADFVIDGLSAYTGLPGATVEIFGEGFTPEADYAVTLSGQAATVTGVTPTTINFIVPGETPSGLVTIEEGEQTVRHPLPFFTRRPITGEFRPPLGVTPEGYQIFDGDKLNPVAADGSFQADIITGVAKLMWAVRQEKDPYFLVVALPGDEQVVIDARSTALADMLLFPELMTTDPGAVAEYLEKLPETPTFEAYANRLAAVAADGAHFVDDESFDALQASVALELIEALNADEDPLLRQQFVKSVTAGSIEFEEEDPFAPRPLIPGVPGGALMRDFSPNWKETRIPPVTPHLFDSSMGISEDEPENYFIFSLKNDNTSPTDAVLELWEVDPQSVGGFEEFLALRADETLETIGDKPVNTGYSRASLFFNFLDRIETVAAEYNSFFNPVGYIASFFGYGNDDLAADQFRLDRNKPAVYEVRAYSGCVHHTFINPLRDQREMIQELDTEGAYDSAIKINAIIAAINLAGGSGLDPSKLPGLRRSSLAGDIVDPQFGDLSKQITAVLCGQGWENLDERALRDTIKASAEALIEFAIGQALETFYDASRIGLSDKLDKLAVYSNRLQAAERVAKMFLPEQLALERKLIVIGDPFRPTIRRLSILEGRDEDLLQVSGNNFGIDFTEITVSFANFTGPVDDDPTTPLPIDTSTEIVAPIIPESLTDESFKLQIPDAFDHFADNRAALVFTLSNGKQTTTAELDPPLEFTFLGPGEVDRAEPEQVFNSRVISLLGEGFDFARPLRYSARVDGVEGVAEISNVSPDAISMRLAPDNLEVNQELTLELFYRDELVGSAPFRIFVPTTSVGDSGVTARITKADFSNAADGEISIFEAFALANGTLGRGVQLRPEDDDIPPFPITRFEEDFVVGLNEFGQGGGPAFNDGMRVDSAIAGTRVTLPGPLPDILDGDSFSLDLVFDASGVADPAIDLEDRANVSITRLTLENSGVAVTNSTNVSLIIDLENPPGDGVRIQNGCMNVSYSGTINNPGGTGVRMMNSDGNAISGVRVNNAGEYGVFLQESSRNALDFINVLNPREHGLYLLGPNCGFNQSRFPSTGLPGDTFASFNQSQNGYGVVIENGAANNLIEFGEASGNALGGILLSGPGTIRNTIGENAEIRPALHLVENNGGDGVVLSNGANENTVRWLYLSNNRGNGVKLDGVSRNTVDSCFTYSDAGAAAGPMEGYNDENGLLITGNSQHNLIGSKTLSFNSSFGLKSGWAANRRSAIVLDGPNVAFNTVNRARVGDAFPLQEFVVSKPNGEHGVVLRNGAHDNVIGDTNGVLDLEFFDVPHGACILLEGEGTRNNRVLGNQIGSAHDFVEFDFVNNIALQPKIGVHIRDGASGNIIGEPGDLSRGGPNPTPSFFGNQDQPYNVICGCTEAGILIENAGAPDAPNIIRNNRIGEQETAGPYGNFVGIHIKGSGFNIIGDELPGRGNRITGSIKAGLWLEDVDGAFERSTRIVDNEIVLNRGDPDNDPANPDPANGPVNGTGILITGGGDFQLGEDLTRANQVSGNVVGVHIDSAAGYELVGTRIFDNDQAGVAVTNGGPHTIGSDQPAQGNRIHGNGSGGPEDAGVIISNSPAVRVSGNLIGDDGMPGGPVGNNGAGIRVVDASDVRIGGDAIPLANLIVENTGDGIRLENAANALIQSNLIGVDRAMNNRGNGASGIHLLAGSTGTIIGGRIPEVVDGQRNFKEAPNSIAFNNGEGVLVAGGSTRNQIVSNAIFNNGAAGIAHRGGGNNNQPAPINAARIDRRVEGSVDINEIPVGSLIQAFTNFAPGQDEGEVTLGTGEVLTGGVFSFPLGIYPSVNGFTLTATHPATGDTSEFSVPVFSPVPALTVSREGDPQAVSLPVDGETAVFPLDLSATGALIRVTGLTIRLTGTALTEYELAAATLYRDVGRPGLTGVNELAAGVVSDAGDGVDLSFSFDQGGANIQAGETQRWIIGLALIPAVADPTGASLQLAINSADDLSATAVLQASPITPLGDFPIESDTYATTRSALALARAAAFGADADDPTIAGPLIDFDGDGLVNVIELLLGTDPTSPDAAPPFRTERTADGRLALTFFRAAGANFEVIPELSADLKVWSTGEAIVERIEEVPDGNGGAEVTVTFKPSFERHPRLFGRIATPVN